MDRMASVSCGGLCSGGVTSTPSPPGLTPRSPATCSRIFGKTLAPPFDLTINHWAPPNIELGEAPRRATRLAVAWTMWEFMEGAVSGSAFHGFKDAKVGTMRERFKWFDLVLGYDPVSVAAMEPYTAKHTAVGLLQGATLPRTGSP